MLFLKHPIKIFGISYTRDYFKDSKPSYVFAQNDFYTSIYSFLNVWYNNDDHIIVKTSGSTGTPSNIKLSKTAIYKSAIKTCSIFNLTDKSSALLVLPVRYIAGKLMLIRAIASGLNLHLSEPNNNPLAQLKQDIDFIALTPTQLQNAISNPEDINKCKTILVGGAPIDNTLIDVLRDFEADIYQSFGMTETATHVALRKLNHSETVQPYKAIPGVSFNVDNRNCLLINASHISPQPIVTNDMVELIDANHFFWKGRFDFVINTGGIKVFPEEIENKLSKIISFPFYIAGKKDETLGEKVVLILESKNYSNYLSLKEDSENCISAYEKPRQIIKVKKIRFSANGKIIREISL